MKLKNEILVIDQTTQEVLTQQKTYSIKVQSHDKFHATFFDYLPELHSLQYTQRKVFDELAAHSNLDTGLVALIPSIRTSILTRAAISDGQLRNSLVVLKKKGFITGSRSEYYINPKYLWRGTSDSRANVLKNKWKVVLDFEIEETPTLSLPLVQATVSEIEQEGQWQTIIVEAIDEPPQGYQLDGDNQYLEQWEEDQSREDY